MEYRQTLRTLSTRYQKLLHAEQAEDHYLAEGYRARLTTLAGQYGKCAKVPVPILTIPRIFGRTHDENFISDYLAYILDPEKNGLGTAPLEAFLRLCQIDIINIPLEHIHITREYMLEGGRIDLLIECGDSLAVGVENKIYSLEGSGQTIHYSRVLDNEFPDIPHPLVFLTRDGSPAGAKNAIPISYTALWKALKVVLVIGLQDHRKLVLWEDFLEHLEVYIMKNNSSTDRFEFSEKARLYFENYEMINDLTETYKQEWGDAIAFLEKSLKIVTGESWDTYFPDKYGFQQVYKPAWISGPANIHFEWWFSFDTFQKGFIKMMVDVEGKKAGEALTFFDGRCKKLEKTYAELGIEYRPNKRKIAIAFKEYSIEQDINKIAEKYLESFNEFRFLEPVIDEVAAAMAKKA